MNVRPGILSAVAMATLTALTLPPRATVGPDAGKSVEVETVTPVAEAAMGLPIVPPVRVMVTAPAAISAVAVTAYSIHHLIILAVVAKLVAVTPMAERLLRVSSGPE